VTASAAFASVSPGEILAGTYRVERLLGRGGMGVVLAARHLVLGEPVAIKILTGEYTDEATSRFLGEAQAAARIRSDHVVRVFEFGRTEEGCPFIVMEYLEGQDLGQVLRAGPVQVADAVSWTLEACDALAHAHRDGIIHRDLKPANLFLERRPNGSTRIKLLDFGIAKLPQATGLTGTSQMLGSPVYMAPEQFSDSRDVDVRTDVWGLGSVLYQAITGRPPFGGSNILEIALSVRESAHVRADSLRADLPDGLSLAIDRCLAKERDARWPRIAALAHALAPFASEEARSLLRSIDALSPHAEGRLDSGPQSPPIEPFLREILEALTQLRDGHFTGNLWSSQPGLQQQIAQVFNDHLQFIRAYRDAHLKLMEEVGVTGRLGGLTRLADLPSLGGEWKRMVEASDRMVLNLTNQFRDGANVVAALARGEADARMNCEDIQGEFRIFREQVNALASGGSVTPHRPALPA
jgi:serine/threonine protein kinase